MPTDPSFILGLIAGEGSFSSSVNIDNSRRLNVQAQLQFSVSMEDGDVLESIANDTGIGSVYHRSDGQSSWKAENYKDRRKIIEFVEEHSTDYFEQTRKYEQFTKWRRANEMYGKGVGEDINSKSDMKEFVRTARLVNKGVGKKPTKNSIERLLTAIDSGRIERYECGSTNTTTGEPCTQSVSSPDETCVYH